MFTVPIEYEQTDLRWKNLMYSNHGDRSQKIGNSGCGPTCAAMVVATLKKPGETPKEAASWAVKNGYRTDNDGTAWAYFVPYFAQFNISCEQTGDTEKAVEALKNDLMVISAAGPGLWTTGGHFILAYGLDGDKVLIHDPNSETPARELAELSKYKEQTVQHWIIKNEWKGVEKIEVREISIKNLDTGKRINVDAVNIDGNFYVKLRHTPRMFPVVIDNEGAVPTMRLNLLQEE